MRSQSEAQSTAALSAALVPLTAGGRWVLAVSGGRDSMALLDAMSTSRGREIAMVATFDHGTGPAATEACALVIRAAAARGLSVVSGKISLGEGTGEAHWRAARLRFLSQWARRLDAAVMTAHTRDDQVETVLMRLLRNAGPRGLAGMFADVDGSSAIVRPLLGVARATVASYAAARRIPFVDDPSNTSVAFQRNRIRHELLPALERAQPGFSDWCLDLATRAAAWRRDMEDAAAALCATSRATARAGTVVVHAKPLASLREAEWQVLWPALAARAGITMDRRGVVRAATWAPGASVGSHIPLSGDARIERTSSTFVIRRGTPLVT